ncbi:hypothetical protein GGR56DRAFT_690686 [Xylariaceae sp. FL0804]|nr:hypothetical protein GGR56DRAFT_690686 [Xylariaceae sp. FL0804]
MEEPTPDYFTCSLGQAALLRKQSRIDDPFLSIIQLVETQAALRPRGHAVGFPYPGNNDSEEEHLQFGELNSYSISTASALSSLLNQHIGVSSTVGLISSSSLDFILTWLGCMRLGWKVFLLAPQLDIPAIKHLCEGSSVKTILADEAQESRISELQAEYNLVRIPSYKETVTSHAGLDIGGSQTPDIAYLRHTSGTSSGLPKPIVQTQWGAVGCFPVFTTERQGVTFSTTPLYHGGLADCLRAWTSGVSIWLFPEGKMPITAANVVSAVRIAEHHCQHTLAYFSSVPYVLQMLAEEPEGIRLLQRMALVGVGGAALPPAVGDRLVDLNVRLVSRMGSAECGFLMSSHRHYDEDHEWQYLRPIDDPTLLAFEPRDDCLFELVVKPGWPLRAKTNRDDGSYATADLFEPHSTIPNAWRYHSRADAQITLANGKKFDPSPLEGSIRASSDMIRDVLIFGSGRDYPGALIFKAKADSSDAEVLDAVWPEVQAMNAGSSAHARLVKPMLVVLNVADQSEPLPKSSKGTILRKQAEARYADAIEQAYSGADGSLGAKQDVPDNELLEAVSQVFTDVLGRDINTKEDLYAQSVDSMSCIHVRRMLARSFMPAESPPLPLNIIYDQGSIENLVRYLIEVRHGRGHDAQTTRHEEDDLDLMRRLFEKYSHFDSSSSSRPSPSPSPHVPTSEQHHPAPRKKTTTVVLTGATGALGSHLLAQLVRDARVRRIYCLVRAATPSAARHRVSEALRQRRLPPLPLEEDDDEDAKVVCLPCSGDFAAPGLGLGLANDANDAHNANDGADGTDYPWAQRLASEATVFVHAAWAVHFGLRLGSFEGHVAGTRALLDAATGIGATFVFVSSTAAAIAAAAGGGGGGDGGGGGGGGGGEVVGATTIPEAASRRPSDAAPLGYARSKWVAEGVCAAAAADSNSNGKGNGGISVIRVGQLCGSSTAGVWNRAEAYPLLLSTAGLAGCLPDLPGEALNWLPVDKAARAVLEIALPPPAAGDGDPVVAGGGGAGKRGGGEGGAAAGAQFYHVLNPHRTPSWRQMLDWISASESASSTGRGFEIVSPREWIERLQNALEASEEEHPSQALLGLWKRRYLSDEKGTAGTGEDAAAAAAAEPSGGAVRTPPKFDIAAAQAASEAMSKVEPLGREAVLSMWEWISENC